MRIAIIGTARSRSTILFHIVSKQYPSLTCLFEFFTQHLKNNVPFLDIANALLAKDNYIVKILCHNLFAPNATIECLHLEKYDYIHMIERPDFFHQCCSLQFSKDYNIWHNTIENKFVYSEIRKMPSTLKLDSILHQAGGVNMQIELKKYLIQHNINFVINDYNDPRFDSLPNILSDPKLDYESIITNYHYKDLIESLFKKHFDYNTLRNDLNSFTEELLLNFVVP